MLTRKVDGKTKVLSDAEEAEIRAEWAKNESGPTPAEIEARKIKQVENELGKANIRVIVDTILPKIKDGTISEATTDSIINEAMIKRKNEL